MPTRSQKSLRGARTLPLPAPAGTSRKESTEKYSVCADVLLPASQPCSAAEVCLQGCLSPSVLSPHPCYSSHYKEVTLCSPCSQLLCSRSHFTLPPAVHKGVTFLSLQSHGTSLSSHHLTLSRDPALQLQSDLKGLLAQAPLHSDSHCSVK